MESFDIVKIRLQGIIGCLDEYTSEPTITTIRESLKVALKEKNYETILFACMEIKDWYANNISNICSNDYVHNKDAHRKNIQIIGDIISNLEENKEDLTTAFSIANKAVANNTLNVEMLSFLLNRFHHVAMQLRDRYDDRETLDVSDEYDVQDLLHALLNIYANFLKNGKRT